MEGNNKLAVITGGARGIGKSIALKLAGVGNDIAIWDLLEEEGNETKKEIEQLGRKCFYTNLDITDEEKVKKTVNFLSEEVGHIDILVNNAGITKDGLLMKMPLENFRKVIEVNLIGSFVVTKSIIRMMIRKKYGRIVNISSVVGLFGNAGQANYSSSKAGLIGFTKSVAKEVSARGITVNAICPGFIQSEMTDKLSEEVKKQYLNNIPANKFGTPDNIAELVAFLTSDQSSYITGEVIRIDGGLAM